MTFDTDATIKIKLWIKVQHPQNNGSPVNFLFEKDQLRIGTAQTKTLTDWVQIESDEFSVSAGSHTLSIGAQFRVDTNANTKVGFDNISLQKICTGSTQ